MYSEDTAVILNRMLGNMSDTTDKTEGYLAYDNAAATGPGCRLRWLIHPAPVVAVAAVPSAGKSIGRCLATR